MQPRTQGLLCTRLGKEGPGKCWSRVRQILQESWSISPRAGFVEIMTGGKEKFAKGQWRSDTSCCILFLICKQGMKNIYCFYTLQ